MRSERGFALLSVILVPVLVAVVDELMRSERGFAQIGRAHV